MSKLDEIVSINISINSPAVDSANFDHMLIFGPPPKIAKRTLPVVAVYTDTQDLEKDGYVITGPIADPIGVAARVAFSQIPKPDKIYVAAQKKIQNEPLLTNADIKIITAVNAMTDGIPVGSLDPLPTDLPWLQLAYERQEAVRLEMKIEKDGSVVWEDELADTSANASATGESVIQVCLGDSASEVRPNAAVQAHLNLPVYSQNGTYTVTLTSAKDDIKSVLTASVTYNGTDYTVNGYTYNTTPSLQSPVETLNAALGTNGWYIACAAGIAESEFEEIAQWTEAQIKQFSYTFMSLTDPVGEVYYRSHGWCGLVTEDQAEESHESGQPSGTNRYAMLYADTFPTSDSDGGTGLFVTIGELPASPVSAAGSSVPADSSIPQANYYLHVAACAKCLSFPAGSETWAFKQLAAVYPSDVNTTSRRSLTEGHSNFCSQYAGRNITMNGQVRANEWIDTIRGRDWLQNDMQLRIFNLLLEKPKIYYTNSGISLVENQMIASLKSARKRGIVAEDEYDEDGQLVKGFTTSVPNAASLTPTQRASRVLRDCTFSARLAGAIHVIRVDGALTY